MLARALMTFNAFNMTAQKDQIIELDNEKVFLDLAQAGFVEQVDRVSKTD